MTLRLPCLFWPAVCTRGAFCSFELLIITADSCRHDVPLTACRCGTPLMAGLFPDCDRSSPIPGICPKRRFL